MLRKDNHSDLKEFSFRRIPDYEFVQSLNYQGYILLVSRFRI